MRLSIACSALAAAGRRSYSRMGILAAAIDQPRVHSLLDLAENAIVLLDEPDDIVTAAPERSGNG